VSDPKVSVASREQLQEVAAVGISAVDPLALISARNVIAPFGRFQAKWPCRGPETEQLDGKGQNPCMSIIGI
jgi:hypothetical protein